MVIVLLPSVGSVIERATPKLIGVGDPVESPQPSCIPTPNAELLLPDNTDIIPLVALIIVDEGVIDTDKVLLFAMPAGRIPEPVID